MSILTILLFFIYLYGMGFGLTLFMNYEESFLERNIMRLGLGLGAFAFLSVLFGIIGIPLDWKVFLLVSLLGPAYYVSRNYKRIKLPAIKLRKSDIYIFVVILMFLITLFVYNKGSSKYPWLEDDDSWNHATGIKLVAVEKNIKEPTPAMYIDPYPPAYDIILGVLHQTSPSMQWTMKFFNNLIISLGIMFFYFFALHFTGKRNLALFSTFVLFSLPSYLSHFIWSHSLVVTIFIVILYCVEMINKNKRWIYASAVIIASAWLVQPSQPLKFLVLIMVYIIVKSIYHKRVRYDLLGAVFAGYLLPMIWWFKRMDTIVPGAGKAATAGEATAAGNAITSFFSKVLKAMPPSSGSATRAYSFRDIIFAQHQNMINNPIGIGLVISILIALGSIAILLSYKSLKDEKNSWKVIALIWAVLTFLGFNTMTFHLPIGFYSFRFWMLFALFGSVVAAEGADFILHLLKEYKLIVIAIIIIGILFTSAHQKYSLNTAIWPPGLGWMSFEEVSDYSWLRSSLPTNTKVFTFVDNNYVLGFDMFTCGWCEDINNYRETAINQSAADLHRWLRSHEYEYLVVDPRTVNKYDVETINNKLTELINSGLYTMAHKNIIIALRVN